MIYNEERRKMAQVKVNEAYELYQIITDFANPLEIFREGIQNSFDANADKIVVKVYERDSLGGSKVIIDIANNGEGLPRDKISNFFNVADSTKVNSRFIPNKSTQGYKGHGAKVFFNADEVVICSKMQDDYWAVNMVSPIQQIESKKCLEYSDFKTPTDLDIAIPDEWETGFFVRIISPKAFETTTKRKKLNHMVLRDYCQWFTIIGTIATLYDKDLKEKNINLFLMGINTDSFKDIYNDISKCDPVPSFEMTPLGLCEKIPLGHYFPPMRTTKKQMKAYVDSIKSTYHFFHYYSDIIFNEIIDAGSFSFRFVISIEGYETKRRYDLLLSRRGKRNDVGIEGHTDSSRYGLWACKGGVPVEKVDDWITGGKGNYSYMQAFIDYDGFNLTANRGSVQNTDVDKLELIQSKINEIWNDSKIQKKIKERQQIEEEAKIDISVDEERKNLRDRFNNSKKRGIITFKDGTKCPVPAKNKSGGYSESETFVLLLKIMEKYPKIFKFKLLDYNTVKGIDFVVEDSNGDPKYIELKGTLTNVMNHPFSCIHSVICFDTDIDKRRTKNGNEGLYITDLQEENAELQDKKSQYDSPFDDEKVTYTMYTLVPESSTEFTSMNVIRLKSFLTEVLGATIVE